MEKTKARSILVLCLALLAGLLPVPTDATLAEHRLRQHQGRSLHTAERSAKEPEADADDTDDTDQGEEDTTEAEDAEAPSSSEAPSTTKAAGINIDMSRKEDPREAKKKLKQEKADKEAAAEAEGDVPVDQAGRVRRLEGVLETNRLRQAIVRHDMERISNPEAFESKVDADVLRVANETQTLALAELLGNMWKEMNKFSTPFYKVHLEDETVKLKKDEVHLVNEIRRIKGLPPKTTMRAATEAHPAKSASTSASVALGVFVALVCGFHS